MGESRRLWVLPIVVSVLGALFGAGLLWAVIELDHRADEAVGLSTVSADVAEQNADTAEQLAADVDALREQVETLGEEPVAPPPEDTVEELPRPPVVAQQGERGPGPTMAQIRAAVRNYLTANPPAPGRPPTQGEIDAAVAAFCASDNCRGADGRDAEDGADGTDGDPGRPPTAEEIAAAVAAFCANGNCRGEAGTAGSDGADGQDGRGIVTVVIEGDARECELVVSYTDDTQDRIPVNGLMCVRLSEE